MTTHYTKLPGLADVYLEDSFVLEIREVGDSIAFRLEAVLTENHPLYHAPKPGEQYCYALATLTFVDATAIEWITRYDARYTDADGEVDLGNIDFLNVEDGAYRLGGDWGEVRIVSGAEPIFHIDQ